MKRLYVLRHAKSSWDDPARSDHDRPLAPRGRKAAKSMARHMREQRVDSVPRGLFGCQVPLAPDCPGLRRLVVHAAREVLQLGGAVALVRVGTPAGLDALGARVGMTHFRAVSPVWGETQITTADQTRFFLHIENFIAPLHRAYAKRLLSAIVPSQRWGIGEVAPRGWQLYFKGGRGSGTGLIDNQVALLTRGCARISIAVLTMHDGSHAAGEATLQGIFSRLLRGLPRGRPRSPRSR